MLVTAISEERLAEAFDRLDSDDSGYISAENLKALLGEEFPQSEIDAIIKESDPTKDGKVSYSEFLALWEDKQETKFASDIDAIRQLRDAHDSERSSLFSENSSEDDEDVSDLASRSNFLEGKRLSERKTTVEASTPVQERVKQVGFKEMVHTIPPISSEKKDTAMDDNSETVKVKKESYV